MHNNKMKAGIICRPFFLLFIISPLIISGIQLLHKWARGAMDMSNGSPVLLDGAR